MATAFHIEGTGVFDGEVCYSNTQHGENMSDLLKDVRSEYEKQHGEEKGSKIEFRAWPVEE